MWRKPTDPDYKPPKIKLVKKDLLEQVKVKKVVEVVSIGNVVLVQYFDANQDVQLVAVYLDG